MMKLNKSIANQIVKRTMQIIPNSVNVMDENGVIIASGDPHRLNQRHTGAVVALRNNQVMEIDENLAKLWCYEAKAGINLPLHYFGSPVGVVGISGNPDEVRQYAQLVKMAAELIMEQAFQLEQQSWQRRYKEEFVRELLSAELSREKLNQQAAFLNADLGKPIEVVLIQLLAPTAEHLQTLVAYLEHHYPQWLNTVIGLDKVALIMPLDEKRLSKKSLMALTEFPIACQLVVGEEVESLQQAPISYQTACYTLEYLQKNHNKKRLAYFADYRLPALLNEFSQSWQGKMLSQPLEKLRLADEKQQLMKSLRQYFLSNCDLVHASKHLFIHPNTLRYRLEKIEQLTSLSFNRIEDKFLFYLAVIGMNKL